MHGRNPLPVLSLHRSGGQSLVLGDPRGAVSGVSSASLVYGVQGLGAAPMSFATSPVPAGHGSILRGSRLDEREIFVPVLLRASSSTELANLRDHLLEVLSPLDDRELVLRVEVQGRDGWREIPVHYAGGLAGDFGSGYHGTSQTLGLEFKVTEALWRGEPVQISQQVDPADKPFLSATQSFFPVVLADSTVDAQITVHVVGDAPTAPRWTVIPPGEDLLIRHVTTGARFYLDGLITEPVTIDMATGQLTSASAPSGQLWDRVSLDSRMFELSPGDNDLEFSMVGSTATSMVHVTYSPRWLAGL